MTKILMISRLYGHEFYNLENLSFNNSENTTIEILETKLDQKQINYHIIELEEMPDIDDLIRDIKDEERNHIMRSGMGQ